MWQRKHIKVTKDLFSHDSNIYTLCLSPASVDQRAVRHVQSRCVRHHSFSQGRDSPVALAGEDWARGQMAVVRQLLFAGGPPVWPSLHRIISYHNVHHICYLNCRRLFIHLRRTLCSLLIYPSQFVIAKKLCHSQFSGGISDCAVWCIYSLWCLCF